MDCCVCSFSLWPRPILLRYKINHIIHMSPLQSRIIALSEQAICPNESMNQLETLVGPSYSFYLLLKVKAFCIILDFSVGF